MLSKAELLVAAVRLALLVVATTTEEQQQGVEKRDRRPIQTPTTLADMAKVLVDIQKRINALESSPTLLLQGTPGTNYGGVQYVRWGRTACPSGASLVYKGRIGGEHYAHKGGAANYLCLPETPKYGRYKPGYQDGGYMYGTEYSLYTFNPFNKGQLHDHEAPCTVCYVKNRSAKMMIPATYDCPTGWTREYHGYLMSDKYDLNAKQYICVDEDAEAVPGTHANYNGALIYTVEGVCGSLPCHPYVSGRELTCAVCTR